MNTETRVRALQRTAIAAVLILAGCSSNSRIAEIQQSLVKSTVDRGNFSHMTKSEAVLYLQEAARTYNPYPNDEYATDNTSVYGPPLSHPRMCVFSMEGILDRNENRIVPYDEWIFVVSEGTTSVYDKTDQALVTLYSRKLVYHVGAPIPETLCDAYRRDMRNVPPTEITQEIQNVVTALEFLGVAQQ